MTSIAPNANCSLRYAISLKTINIQQPVLLINCEWRAIKTGNYRNTTPNLNSEQKTMKRNWDLIRWILDQAESCQGGHPIVLTIGIYNGAHIPLDIGELDFGEVCEHILLLGDAGLAEVRELGRTYEGSAGVAIDRLTMNGHDFLEAAKNDTIWNKAMNTVKEKGGSVTLGVLTQLLSTLAKQHFGLS